MIVVPCLAHSDEATTGHVVTLHASAVDMPGARTAVVGEVTDQPMTGYGNRNTNGDAPHQPWHAAEGEKQHSPRQLL